MTGVDFVTMIEFTQKVDPAVATASIAAGSANSLAREDASGLGFILNVGESGDTLSGSVLWTITVQESSDNSSFSAAAAADVDLYLDGVEQSANSIVIDAAADDDVIIHALYKGHEEYVALNIAATGTHTNGTPFSVTGMRRMKVSQ